MNLSAQQTAILSRFLLILAVTDLPIVAAQLAQPVFDWRLLAAGLLTGAAAAFEKALGPQLASVVLPNAVVLPDTKPNPQPTVASIMGPH